MRTPAEFWGGVKAGARSACWEWQRARSRGYGSVWYQGAAWRAHRLAWTLSNGPIPEGMLVCHHCDNPPCCNPAHLFVGSHADNLHDAQAKGRKPKRPPRQLGMLSESSRVRRPRFTAARLLKLWEHLDGD